VKHIRGADVAVPVVCYEPVLDHVNLFLRLLVDHVRDKARQLDRVLLIFEEL